MRHLHGREQHAHREQATAKANQGSTCLKHQRGAQGSRKNNASKSRQTQQSTYGRKPNRINASQKAGGQGKSKQCTACTQSSESTGHAHIQAQDLSAIGFEHDVLHAEGRRTQTHRPQKTLHMGYSDKGFPIMGKTIGLASAAFGSTRFLFPK